eukprot:gene15776-21899_t
MKAATMKTSASRAVAGATMAPVTRPRAPVAVCKAFGDDGAKISALEGALKTGQVLKMQVTSESRRAEANMNELRSLQNQYSDAEFKQAERVKAERILAQEACLQASMALEGEKRRIESIMSESSTGPELVESERQGRIRAEQIAMDLEAKLREASARIQTASAGAAPGSPAAGAAQDANEMMEKLKGEIARGANAKELAVARHKELQATSAKYRDQQKTVQMLQMEAANAAAAAKAAAEELVSVEEARQQILKSAEAAGKNLASAEDRKNNMSQSNLKVQGGDDRLQMIMADATRIQSLKESLAQLESSNEVLKKQVISEGTRASVANRDLARYSNLIKEEAKLRAQLQQETQAKETAFKAAENAKYALQEEKANIERIIREAGPALSDLEEARTNKTMAKAVADDLEAKLRAANDRLAQHSKVITSAEQTIRAPSAVDAAELARAEATIADMVKQMQLMTGQKMDAQELAVKGGKELARANERLRDLEFRCKQMARATEEAKTSALEAQTMLRSAPVSSSGQSIDPELVRKVEAATARANAMEQEVAVLQKELQRARDGMSSDSPANTDNMGEVEAEFFSIQEALKVSSAENDSLKSQVLSEGSRAAGAARELAQAHSRVNEMETMLTTLRTDVSAMKSAMSALKTQMSSALTSKNEKMAAREAEKEEVLSQATGSLKSSQKQVMDIRRETGEIIAALEVAKCRVSLLEREIAHRDRGGSPRSAPQPEGPCRLSKQRNPHQTLPPENSTALPKLLDSACLGSSDRTARDLYCPA